MGAQASPVPDYVPDTGWNDEEWARSFYERWFGRQLTAMGEPPLATSADLAGMRRRFRLLVLPTFKPAFAYRVDEHADGTATLRATRLDGRGGYSPGQISSQIQRQLGRKELKAFETAAKAADLGAQPRQEPTSTRKTNPDGSEEIRFCVDGTTYVFEQLDETGRQYLMRMCDIDEESLARLVRTVFTLEPPPNGWE